MSYRSTSGVILGNEQTAGDKTYNTLVNTENKVNNASDTSIPGNTDCRDITHNTGLGNTRTVALATADTETQRATEKLRPVNCTIQHCGLLVVVLRLLGTSPRVV